MTSKEPLVSKDRAFYVQTGGLASSTLLGHLSKYKAGKCMKTGGRERSGQVYTSYILFEI